MKALVYIETKDGAPVGGSLELFGAAASIGAEAEGIVIGDEAVAKAAADAVGASVSYVEADDCEDVITDVVDGYYLMTPFGRTGLIARILDRFRAEGLV